MPSTLSKGAVNLGSRNKHLTHEQRNKLNQLGQDNLAATESEEDHPYDDKYFGDPDDQ